MRAEIDIEMLSRYSKRPEEKKKKKKRRRGERKKKRKRKCARRLHGTTLLVGDGEKQVAKDMPRM